MQNTNNNTLNGNTYNTEGSVQYCDWKLIKFTMFILLKRSWRHVCFIKDKKLRNSV